MTGIFGLICLAAIIAFGGFAYYAIFGDKPKAGGK